MWSGEKLAQSKRGQRDERVKKKKRNERTRRKEVEGRGRKNGYYVNYFHIQTLYSFQTKVSRAN